MERTHGTGLSKWSYRIGHVLNRTSGPVSFSRDRKIPALVSRNLQSPSLPISQKIIRYHFTTSPRNSVGVRIPRLGVPHAQPVINRRGGGSSAPAGREISPLLSCGDIGEVALFTNQFDIQEFLDGLPLSEEIRLTGECNKIVHWLDELGPKMAQACGQDSEIVQVVRQHKESLQLEYDSMVKRLHQIDAESPSSESERAEIRRKRDDLLHNFSIFLVGSRNLWPDATTTILNELERRCLAAPMVESLRERILSQIASIQQIEGRGDMVIRPALTDNLLRFWPLWNALRCQANELIGIEIGYNYFQGAGPL